MTMKSAYRLKYRHLTLARAALEKAERTPESIAIFVDDGSEIRFGSIVEEARRLATALAALGVNRKDVVSFQLPNWREAVAIDLAASILGLVVNPIIPIYRDRELTFILDDASARVLFIPDRFRGFDYPDMLRRLRGSLPQLEQVVVVRAERPPEGMLDYRQLVDDAVPMEAAPPAVDPDELKLLLYTSGTTGRPKAVMHSHNTLTRAIDNGREAWGLTGGDIMLMPSPVTHITGFANGIELPFLTDTRSAFLDQWRVERAVEFIERIGASACISATPFLQELVQHAERCGTRLPSLRLFVCGGASVPPDLIYSAHRMLANCRACRAYGSTEAPLVTVGYPRPEDEYLAANTDGRIFDWEVQVRDDDDRVLSAGQDGEIVVRGAALMLGYKDVEQTREAFTADGYFRTGDIGHVTPQGAIIITDRKKDLIIRGGENLSAREIEDVLYGHPDIQEAAVVSMPHARLGEGVCAYLVMKPGCKPLTSGALQPYLGEVLLARQKWPEQVEIRDALPKTASGKVRKDLLRKELWKRGPAPPKVNGGDS
jgi:acyl-CoA synthetase (AMP-forming)/AMP-acid ligase II